MAYLYFFMCFKEQFHRYCRCAQSNIVSEQLWLSVVATEDESDILLYVES